MATDGLEKDLQLKIGRLGLNVSSKQKISLLSDEELISVISFLLSRYDSAWYWETNGLSLQSNRKRATRYLRLLEIGHLISSPADLGSGSKRILRLLCALFDKLEKKHGVALYQKPRQVLKPRPRSRPSAAQGGQAEKENGQGRTSKSRDSVSAGIVPHSTVFRNSPPPARHSSQSQSKASSLRHLPVTSVGHYKQAAISQSAVSFGAARSISTHPTITSSSQSRLTSDVLRSSSRSSPSAASSIYTSAASDRLQTPASSTAGGLLLTLQSQINSIQRSIESTSQQQEELRVHQFALSKNLQEMWAQYERNLKLLQELSIDGSRSSFASVSQATAQGVVVPSSHGQDVTIGSATAEMAKQRTVPQDVPNAQGSSGAQSQCVRKDTAVAVPSIPYAASCTSNQPCAVSVTQATAHSISVTVASKSGQVGHEVATVPQPSETGMLHSNTEPSNAAVLQFSHKKHPSMPALSTSRHSPASVSSLRPLTATLQQPASEINQSVQPRDSPTSSPALQFPDLDGAYLERRLQRVLRRSELFLERDRLLQERISQIHTLT